MVRPDTRLTRRNGVITGLLAMPMLASCSYVFLPGLGVAVPDWLPAVVALACLAAILLRLRAEGAISGWIILALAGAVLGGLALASGQAAP